MAISPPPQLAHILLIFEAQIRVALHRALSGCSDDDCYLHLIPPAPTCLSSTATTALSPAEAKVYLLNAIKALIWFGDPKACSKWEKSSTQGCPFQNLK